MLDKGKISSGQLACMLYLAVLSSSMMGAVSFNYSLAKTDFWLSPLIGSVSAWLLIPMLVVLHRFYPGKSLIEYSALIMGRWFGKLIGLWFLFVCLLQNSYQTRQFAELMNEYFFKETPLAIIMGSLLFVCVVAVRLGVEIIGRAAIFFTPIVILIVLTFSLPFIKDIQIDRVLPFLTDGITPVLKSSAYLQIWIPMYVFLNFYLPFLSDEKKAGSRIMLSLATLIITLTGMMLLLICVLDQATPYYSFPFMVLARYLSLFEFLDQFDAFIMFFWVVIVFIRAIVTLYALTIGIAQLANLSSYRALTVPVAVLVMAVSFWGIPRFVDYMTSGRHVVFIYFSANFIVPLLLFLVALMRGKFKAARTSAISSQPPTT
jgi:spore germination protein KB